MPRAIITPQQMPADDSGIGTTTLTATTVVAADGIKVPYDKNTNVIFRTTSAGGRTITLKGVVRNGIAVDKVITVPSINALNNGVLFLDGLDLSAWLRPDDLGMIYIDVDASDFVVSAYRRPSR